MKKKLIPYAIGLLLLCSACHKNCSCLGYDLQVHTYTSSEVDTHTGGNCANMRDFPLPNTYSVCNWE
jgi:hypothetical protein